MCLFRLICDLVLVLVLIGIVQWLGKNSTTTKNKRLVQELTAHTSLSIGQGFLSLRLEYVPFLRIMLLAPLLERGVEGVTEVLSKLEDYGLSKEDFSDTLKDLQFIIDKDPVLSGEPLHCLVFVCLLIDLLTFMCVCCKCCKCCWIIVVAHK